MKLQRNNFPTVRVFDILPKDFCEVLIDVFENTKDGHEYVNHDYKPCFTQLNLNEHHPEIVKVLVNYTQKAYGAYAAEVKNKFLPRLHSLEEFRIKRYLPGGEERFDEHVDVGNHATAKRALAFLFYLNNNDGDTYFSSEDLYIRPRTGKVLVFPPTWEHPHAGLPPTKTKYIMSTYIHYG